MKKVATLIFTLLFCVSIYAEEIPLKEKDKRDNNSGIRHNRTELIVPSASIEDGVINIETELATWGVTVTVYNGDGAVVYTSVSSSESTNHEFAIGTLAEGNYTIEVQLGEELYEGEFELTNTNK